MALANFIDRAATSASQVLSGFQLAEFKSRLEQQVVALVVDRTCVERSEARWTAELAVNLLARLYPRIALISTDETGVGYLGELRAIAAAINPVIEVSEGVACATACLVVGVGAVDTRCTTFYLGSDGWRARLSTKSPVGSGRSVIPYGAGAAACFGVANVFRALFGDQIEGGDVDQGIDVSLFDFRHGADGEGGPDLGTIDLAETHLVGIGAIGNAALWALRRTDSVRGILHLIDHESIELSNLQRYILADQSHEDGAKVEVGKALWEGSELNVRADRATWADYVGARDEWRFERVAVALDNVADRIGVQGALPKRILNAWTQEMDLGVSRHGFADGGPCLCCLYLPTSKSKDEHEIIAEALRLPDASLQIRALLQLSSPVDASFVQSVAGAFAVPFAELERFVGQPVRTFYQNAICGGLMLKLTGDDNAGAAIVPMAFQSALAGIMLAAEIVKEATGKQPAKTPISRINLLRPLAPHLNDPRAPDATGRCICGDEVFRLRYREKYVVRPAVV
jgi:hypothetical protein